MNVVRWNVLEISVFGREHIVCKNNVYISNVFRRGTSKVCETLIREYYFSAIKQTSIRFGTRSKLDKFQ